MNTTQLPHTLTGIRRSMKSRKIDALLLTQPENRRYLSGYTATDVSISETSGVLLIPVDGTPFLFTDSRYGLQAEMEAKGYKVELYRRGLIALLRRKLSSLGIKRLAFESHYFLHSAVQTLKAMTDKTGVDLVPLTGLVEKHRLVKSAEEIEKIKKSVRLNEEVFHEVYMGLKPGQTERQVAMKIEITMKEKGAEGPSFETIVAGGPNGALPHAVPSDRPLKKGEPIIIDMGLKLNGYCSDMTRTIVLGEPDDWTKTLFRIVRKAQQTGIKMIKQGVSAFDVDQAARQVINQAGLGDRFGHGLGHGVGLAVHEAPSLSWRNRKRLKKGMVVTVEPGVYIPDWGGIRLENMVLVKEKDCEVLNRDTTFLDI
ncbi:MAG: Xaa-Pro peptidase family protein [Proteobacteria bacterium]|nr:Xaa-Pro peptidase family protein [Pseudomonadota bacterium]MBU1708748.1 Xaa-Pro peptidase family protein [Pseudomonadota bacterium]